MSSRDPEKVTCEYCGGEYSGQKGLRIHMANVHEEETTSTVPCNWCGKPVEVREWETDEHHYCSLDCGKAWNVFLTSGENHPNYVDGSTRSDSFNWTAWAIRSRDGECLNCGAEKGADDGRNLHVHHIVPEDEGGSHEPTNLISLCGGCHQKIEKLDPDQQLEACGVSEDDLELSGGLREWLDDILESTDALKSAPDPRPGMFAEAQKYHQETKKDDTE